jgi:hypothetical protein
VRKPSASQKNLGGRPQQIDDGRIFNRRDSLIQMLSDAWGDIGWELKCVNAPDELREALSCLGGIVYENQRRALQPLLQSTMGQASAAEIRATRKAIRNAGRHAYEILGTVGLQVDSKPTLISATDRLRDSEYVMAKVSNENLGIVLDEHLSRLSVYRTLKHEMDKIEEERKALETRLSNEEAFYAKDELFRFIKYKKYAYNPRNLANAMAGLPDIGCWQSFQRCEKEPSPLWPTRPEEIPPLSYRVFEIIAGCWDHRDREPDITFLNLLRNRTRTIPESNDLRQHLTKYWRYLRQAVEQIDLKRTVSGAVPYRVFGAIMRNIARPRSDEESVLAAKEQKDIEESLGSKPNF